ncbi:glycosyltransferase family 25 protein [Aquamicrobium sp. LC103]|uniref:glycosyltransferase family 25 protein n=1 Tax=Aquamicrobium sp. LC103 TaxID=1120658 RepID=UPI00063EC9FE|nr:glycosyltransferase family 25 protein [Aquamicrobium sp. LC103]TKT80384.1 glycosyltransferase family 25 protein [Aquamicrobium sp. LC103]
MHVEGFVIHLPRAVQRQPQVERLLQVLPVPARVVEAVDGRALTQEQIAAVYRQRLYRPRYPFALAIGEIGCFLSHRKVWREIVERGLDAGLIVEDDAEIDARHFPAAIDLALEHLGTNGYIRFPWRNRGDVGEALAERNGISLVEPKLVGLGTLAQLVSREAAAKLLTATETFDRPVDTFLQLRWRHKARMLAMRGAGVSNATNQVGGTTVQTKQKSLQKTLSREVNRSVYRLTLRALAARHGI